MPPPRLIGSIMSQLCSRAAPWSLRTSSSILPSISIPNLINSPSTTTIIAAARPFSTTPHQHNWLAPRSGESKKSRKGRCRVPTGGSVRGTTVIWGDYGLRLRDHGHRIAASKLKIAEDTIRKRLRGMKYRLYMRVAANIGVYTSGNESRMGTGKGSFDYWATRVHCSKVLFELKGEVHEQVVKDAFRLAGNKLPGLYEFVRKGDPPVMGTTKLGDGVTKEFLMRPRLKISMDGPAQDSPPKIPVDGPTQDSPVATAK